MWSRPQLPYRWTPSSSTAPSTTPAPPAAVAGAEARDVGSGGAKLQSTDGPPSNDDERVIGLKRKGACTDGERGAFADAQFAKRRGHAYHHLPPQHLAQPPHHKGARTEDGEQELRMKIKQHLSALHQQQDHQHAQPHHAFGHADLLPPPHHHAQSAYQLPPPSYHSVGAYHLPPPSYHAVGHAHPPLPQFHAVGLLPPPYHAQPLHRRGSHADFVQLPPSNHQIKLEYLAIETEEEMARRNARIYALGAYQDEEASRREAAEREEEASRREAAEKEERQREAAEKEEEMARRRSGRDARINAFREYRDKEANALTSSTSRAEINAVMSRIGSAVVSRREPESDAIDWGEKFMRYLSSEEAKCAEMRSRLVVVRESLGDPEATMKAKATLGRRDKIISGIPREEKRATRSHAEAGQFMSFCLKFSGYYNCECCCKARAAEVMDQAKEKLKQEDEEDFFGLKSNLFSSDH